MMNSASIMRIAKDMQSQVNDGVDCEAVREKFSNDFPEFAERYPGLFYRCSVPGMDLSILKMMLSSLDKGDEHSVPQMLNKKFGPNFSSAEQK